MAGLEINEICYICCLWDKITFWVGKKWSEVWTGRWPGVFIRFGAVRQNLTLCLSGKESNFLNFILTSLQFGEPSGPEENVHGTKRISIFVYQKRNLVFEWERIHPDVSVGNNQTCFFILFFINLFRLPSNLAAQRKMDMKGISIWILLFIKWCHTKWLLVYPEKVVPGVLQNTSTTLYKQDKYIFRTPVWSFVAMWYLMLRIENKHVKPFYKPQCIFRILENALKPNRFSGKDLMYWNKWHNPTNASQMFALLWPTENHLENYMKLPAMGKNDMKNSGREGSSSIITSKSRHGSRISGKYCCGAHRAKPECSWERLTLNPGDLAVQSTCFSLRTMVCLGFSNKSSD